MKRCRPSCNVQIGYLHLSAPGRLQAVMGAIGIHEPAFSTLGARALHSQPPPQPPRHLHQQRTVTLGGHKVVSAEDEQHRWPQQWPGARTDVHGPRLHCLDAESSGDEIS